jgi:hypothetical protein
MKLYIDTEFNSYRGRLISMAIVDEDGRNEFYEVLASGALPPHDPWVARNVIPVLGDREPIGLNAFQAKLGEFLNRFGHIDLIADYPSDILHFCYVLETSPGERIATPTMVIHIRPELNTNASKIPHNALLDARALRNMELAT